jgi:hypothetical protein
MITWIGNYVNSIKVRMLPKQALEWNAAVREEGASGYNRRIGINIKVCYDSLSQPSHNIENCKLEMWRISRPRGFKFPHATRVLAIAPRLGSGLTILRNSRGAKVAFWCILGRRQLAEKANLWLCLEES